MTGDCAESAAWTVWRKTINATHAPEPDMNTCLRLSLISDPFHEKAKRTAMAWPVAELRWQHNLIHARPWLCRVPEP